MPGGRNPVTCEWLYTAYVQIFNIIEIFEEHLIKQCGTRRGPINAPQSITGMIRTGKEDNNITEQNTFMTILMSNARLDCSIPT